MLFHDVVHLASKGLAKDIVPFGSPQRFEEVIKDDANAKVLICKPCAEARKIYQEHCLDKIIFGGMNDFHKACSLPDTRIISY